MEYRNRELRMDIGNMLTVFGMLGTVITILVNIFFHTTLG